MLSLSASLSSWRRTKTADVTRAFRIRQVQTASTRTIRIRRQRASGSLAVRTSSSQRGGRWRLRRNDHIRHPKRTTTPTGTPLAPGSAPALRQGRFAPGVLFEEKLWPNVWSRPLSQSGSRPDPNSRGVQLSSELKDDNASRQSFQNHSTSPSTTTAGPPANETGFVALNRNKNALVAAHAAWPNIRRNLNYMGDWAI